MHAINIIRKRQVCCLGGRKMKFLGRWILILLVFASASSNRLAQSRKELRDKEEVKQGTVLQVDSMMQSNRIDPSRVVNLSWQPRIFSYRNFLSDEECDHLIHLVNGETEVEMKVNGTSGNLGQNRQLRTSESQLNSEDAIVTRIEERLSAWTLLPKENSRSLWIKHNGLEEAEKRFDYIGNKSTYGLTEPLMAVVSLYLSNVSHGGEIIFPELKALSDCTRSNDVLKPVKGNAVLFFTVNLDSSPDKSSSHYRCPVIDGEMWYATKFFHLKSIEDNNKENLALEESGNVGDCSDEDDNCPEWAALGECQKNPVFMIGSPDYYGTCRKSCNAC
ncbi:probable prolyl 4-hydroxylase 12 [Rutidosis leptorrhynchoides]|uniref:probable prolyl 4-hydroxylase 12 n=1 Tax=Rutidosis leptorrhynchoides TaxID=125765 RepID=UPI003A99DA34